MRTRGFKMGKKGKKKGSGKKKGGKKGKKSGEPQMTWKEALLAYQIKIKDSQSEDIRYELKALQEQNMRHKERNERLTEEQGIHIKNMLKQSEEVERKLADEEVIDKKEVVAQMMDNWAAERQEQRDIAVLKEQIARLEAESLIENKQVEYWHQYEKAGQHDHCKQILLLEQELIDMQEMFDEMAGHLERTLNQAKSEIQVTTDETLESQKYLATEKAMAKMDKYSRQEVLDNDWLLREVNLHRTEVEILLKEVESLEKNNLSVMGELFECQVDDLKISRNFFLTQFADSENLDETGILEMDLSKLNIENYKLKQGEPTVVRAERPKSAIQKAIEDKVFSLPDKAKPRRDSEEEESEFDGGYEHTSDDEDPFNNYFQFDDEDFDDYLKLGPLELKLLNITGQQMQVIRPKTPGVEELKAQSFKPQVWPVTAPMLHSTIKK